MQWGRVLHCQTRATSSFNTSIIPGTWASSLHLTGLGGGGPENRQPRPHPWKDLRFSRERQGKAPRCVDTPKLRGVCSVLGLP